MAATFSLDTASINDAERRTLDRLVNLLQSRLGGDLVAIWLYGSRARGDEPHEESDIDLMVVTKGGWDDARLVIDLVFDAAEAEGTNPASFSTQTVPPEWIAQRREIQSFYLREVDRDKIVLSGTP